MLGVPSGTLGEWETPLAKERKEHRHHSDRVGMLESHISENLRLRQERRHRLTVFARQVEATECPRTHPKTKDEHAFLDKVLSEDKKFIFCDFSDKERQFMLDILQTDASIKKGELLFTVGDLGEYFYIIDKGTIEILSDHDTGTINTKKLKRGDAFGELALLFDVPRITTARAKSDCVVWKMHQHCFRAKLAHHAMNKEEEMVALLRPLSLFENMEDKSLRQFANAMERVHFEKEERIVNKGDIGNIAYIIEEGTVLMHDLGIGDSKQMDVELNAGESFGVRALVTGEPRYGNSTAKTSVTAWAVDRKTFEELFGPLQETLQHEMKRSFLKAIPIFANSDIHAGELDQLTGRMVEFCLKKGHHFEHVGKPYRQELIIIKHGRIAVYDGTGEGGKVFTLKSGAVYGDKHIRDRPGATSGYNVVCEENTTVWALRKQDIEDIIGDFNRLGQSVSFKHQRRVSVFYDNKVQLKHLDKVKVLGAGGFGKVWLVKHRVTGTHYALKELNKRGILDKKQTKNVLREKDILGTLQNPFILSEVSSFQDEACLYILTNLVEGGELYSMIVNSEGRGLPKEAAVFYGSCIHAAIAHLHERNICYRDLKPENVMIGKDGYCVLVDLGFAKVVTTKTFTLCGTPEYLAPEVFMSQGHDRSADLWSYGVLLYELITGRSAFYKHGQKQVDMFKSIVRVQYDLPPTVDAVSKDLIQKLLVRNPSKRLGNLSNGAQDIEDHKWFAIIDWKALRQKKISAPWIPEIKAGAAVIESQTDGNNGAYRELSFGRPLSMEEQAIFNSF